MWHRMHFLDLQQLDRWPNGWMNVLHDLSNEIYQKKIVFA